ncbi:uncharacterized protein JCM10292_001280 [Rhodotorula paludigena]|uniref:uncharacterized protein n=1 Tax=Rhodotorula paludigena TaxID=86838 RepID=UPI0031796102
MGRYHLKYRQPTPEPVLDPSTPIRCTLPHELVEHIFHLASPKTGQGLRGPYHCSWTTFPLRARYYLGIAGLSRAWNRWAMNHLYRHVVLRDDDALSNFVEHADAVRARSGARTETLRIGGFKDGRRMNGERLAEVLKAVQPVTPTERDPGLSELWLISVRGVDLRDIRDLANLRQLYCIDMQLTMAPSSSRAPVPASAKCLPLLDTLVLKDIDLAHSLRSIMFEDHHFESLFTLYVDSHEAFTQAFDGNPHALPDLLAFSPARDTPVEYFDVLDHGGDDVDDDGDDEDENENGDGDASGVDAAAEQAAAHAEGDRPTRTVTSATADLAATDTDTTLHGAGGAAALADDSDSDSEASDESFKAPLRQLNVTADFLSQLPQNADSIPLSVKRLRLDFAPEDVMDHELDALLEDDFLVLFNELEPPYITNNPFREGILHVDYAVPEWVFEHQANRRAPQFVEQWKALLSNCSVRTYTFQDDDNIRWQLNADTAAPERVPKKASPPTSPQDALVPWGFLESARQAASDVLRCLDPVYADEWAERHNRGLAEHARREAQRAEREQQREARRAARRERGDNYVSDSEEHDIGRVNITIMDGPRQRAYY